MTDLSASRPDPLHPPAAEATPPAAPAPMDTPAPLRLSATEAQAAMARGALSAEALMAATLDQIAALNGAVNAIVQLREPGALMAEARAADAARAAGRRPGPLHGIPMAFKEMVPAQGFRATSGSPLLATLPPNAADGLLAARMKAAGAIPIGKTNIPEFGLGSHSFNPVYGAVRNPWDLSRSAGGSSGGAGVALALRMVAVADGSDLMGSLRNPAGWNNVWGLRPSQGRIPSESSQDVWLHQLATDGPMARSVADLAMLLEVQAGPHPDHPLALPAMRPGLPARIADGSLEGAKIGWVGDWNGHLPLSPDMAALMDAARDRLETLGAEVVQAVPDVDPEAVWQAWIDLRSWMVASKAGGSSSPIRRCARG